MEAARVGRPGLPEVVFLDVGDTIVRAHPSWAAVYAGVLPEFGIEVSPPAFSRALNEAFEASQLDGPFEATEEASFERLRAMDSAAFATLGHDDLPDVFFRRVDDAFRARTAWSIFPDVVPSLDALLAAGIRLAVISNWAWSAPELLHDLELARHFEALIISARVGYQKPHRGIFEHALDVMQVAPERAIHVGDSYRADVIGARAVGITPVFIDRRVNEDGHSHGVLPPDAEVAVVRDLFELLDLIGVERPSASLVTPAT